MTSPDSWATNSTLDSASSRRRRLVPIALALLCSAFTAFAVAAPPAFAERTLVGTIGGLSEPSAVSFDGNGNAWVSAEAEGQAKVLEYGAFPSQRRLSSITSISGSVSRSIAVNDSTGFLYVGNNGSGIEVFDNTGSLSAEWPVPSVGCFPTIAIDNSGGPSAGVAYINHCNTSNEYIEAVNANDEPADFASSASYVSGNHITGTPAGPLGRVIDVTTDAQGDLYALEDESKLVDEFKPNGEFIRSLVVPKVFENQDVRGIAVDPSTGDLLISDIEHDVIYELSPSGVYLGLITLPQFGYNGGLAVNPEGYVYVPVAGSVHIYASAVALPTISYSKVSNQTATGGTLNASIEPDGAGEIVDCYFEYGPAEAYGGPYNSVHVPCAPVAPYSGQQDVSAAVSGLTSETRYHYRVVVKEASGQVVNGPEELYTPHVVDGLETEPPTKLEPGSAVLDGSLVGDGEPTKYYFEWGTSTAYGEKTPDVSVGSPGGPNPVSLSAEITDLAFETAYHYRVVAVNGRGTSYGEDISFRSSGAVPGLSTGKPTEIAPEGATLNGSLTGDGELTTYYFEWGTTTSYGEKTLEVGIGSPSGPQPTAVSAALTGLHPITDYHYRIVATDGVGVTYGEDQEFETLPLAPVVTESVNGVQSDLAVLHAGINPGGGRTTYHFEYATQAEYEEGHGYAHQAPIPDGVIQPSFLFESVSTQLSGLRSDTVYHWRVTATNADHTTFGPDRTFTTYALSQGKDSCSNAHVRQQTGTAGLLDCRAYELVSASDTGGYNVESSLVEGQDPYPSYPEAGDPSRVLYAVNGGGIPGTNNPTDKGPDPYVATRGEGGWSTEYVGVPADNPFSAAPFTSSPSGAGSGLEAFAYGGPHGCSPCFEGGYTGIPVRASGSKEIIQGMVAAQGFPTPPSSARPDGSVAKDLSANGQHLIFGSTTPFAEGGNENTGDVSLYDRNLTTKETHLVSNSPAGMGHPLDCLQGVGDCDSPGDTNGISELDISSDGSHILVAQKVSEDADHNVYWHLYMNIGDSEKTIALTPDATGLTGGVLFDGMTADGSKVFFSSDEHLTGEDTSHSGVGIFMWSQKGEEEGKPLTLISTGTEGTGNVASCNPVANSAHLHWNTVDSSEQTCGDVAIGGAGGVSSGNGTLYFLSPEKLDGSAHGVVNAPNLYVVRPGADPRFVATLESSLTGPYPPATRHPLLDNFGSFSEPKFIAADDSGGPSNGDIYVADTNAGVIYKYNSSHELMVNWGEHGKLTANFEIDGITVGPSGTFYVFLGSDNILEYAQNGTLESTVSIDPSFHRRGEFFQPTGIAVDAAGNFYLVTEEYSFSEQENVEKFSSSGKFLGQVTTTRFATGLAIDPSNGDLYVANEGNSVDRYAFNGSGEVIEPSSSPCPVTSVSGPGCKPTEVFASELSGATGIAVDASHDVYVDQGNQVIEFESSGKQVGLPIGSGHLLRSTSVTLDSRGDVYAANPYRNDVSVFGPSEPNSSPATDNPAVADSVGSAGVRHTADFQVSPSGEYAVFTSTLPLTGFESADHEEVYRYDAATGSLICVSCDPTGDEPSFDSELAPDGLSLTDDGRVFFSTAEPLVEADGDNRKDVYEWEPEGAGPEAAVCNETSPIFSKASDGCLNLITTGTSAFDASLLGVSANGTDAYFFSRDKLVSQAESSNFVKIYDARELGGFEYTPPHIPCKASDECHGPSSPIPPPPNIHVNTGVSGNEAPPTIKKCLASSIKRHGRCVKKAHRQHHRKHRPHAAAHKRQDKK